MGEVFGEGEGGCSFCNMSSRCWKPFKSAESWLFTSISLALESITACSTLARQPSGVGSCC